MAVTAFGRLDSGEEVLEIGLSGGGLDVAVLTYGAVIRDLRIHTANGPRSVVLGHDRLDQYVEGASFFGAVVGRCANRIAGGRFELDGRTHQLDLNEADRTHLHGGSGGIWNRVWTVVEIADDAATLELVSADGDQGYPGSVTIRCRYALTGRGTLAIDLTATTDAPTPVNLATHSYFDLDRGDTILDHRLTVPAEAVTPVDTDLVPTGVILPVEGTALDFRAPRRMGDAGGSLDLNYVIASAPVETPRLVARVEGPVSGLTLEIHSTEPGLQVYDGNMMKPGVPLADGRAIRRNGGLCLEPQRYPDAVHHAHFPSVILRPQETYRQRTDYHLEEG
jgi:aldose 1-epimerase